MDARKWHTNVVKARTYVKDYDRNRWIIADLANEVCVEGKNRHKDDHAQFSYVNFAAVFLCKFCKGNRTKLQNPFRLVPD